MVAMSSNKVGVFILSDYDFNKADGIYLFDSIEDAIDWQYDTLVENGLAMDANGGFELVNVGHYDSKAEIVESYQDGLERNEFFHVYDVHSLVVETDVPLDLSQIDLHTG